MPARNTARKSEGASRAHLNALGDEIQLILDYLGATPTGFVRNSEYPVGVAHETLNRYVRRRDQDPAIATLVRLALAFNMAGADIDPFHFVILLAEESYKQVAPEYQYKGKIELKIETPDTIGTPGMPMQVVRDYQALAVVDREVTARAMLKLISRDFPMFGGDRLEQIRCLVQEAVERSTTRKCLADAIGLSEAKIKAIVDGIWEKAILDDMEILRLATKVYDSNNRLNNIEFFSPLKGEGSRDLGHIDPPHLQNGTH